MDTYHLRVVELIRGLSQERPFWKKQIEGPHIPVQTGGNRQKKSANQKGPLYDSKWLLVPGFNRNKKGQ